MLAAAYGSRFDREPVCERGLRGPCACGTRRARRVASVRTLFTERPWPRRGAGRRGGRRGRAGGLLGRRRLQRGPERRAGGDPARLPSGRRDERAPPRARAPARPGCRGSPRGSGARARASAAHLARPRERAALRVLLGNRPRRRARAPRGRARASRRRQASGRRRLSALRPTRLVGSRRGRFEPALEVRGPGPRGLRARGERRSLHLRGAAGGARRARGAVRARAGRGRAESRSGRSPSRGSCATCSRAAARPRRGTSSTVTTSTGSRSCATGPLPLQADGEDLGDVRGGGLRGRARRDRRAHLGFRRERGSKAPAERRCVDRAARVRRDCEPRPPARRRHRRRRCSRAHADRRLPRDDRADHHARRGGDRRVGPREPPPPAAALREDGLAQDAHRGRIHLRAALGRRLHRGEAPGAPAGAGQRGCYRDRRPARSHGAEAAAETAGRDASAPCPVELAAGARARLAPARDRRHHRHRGRPWPPQP